MNSFKAQVQKSKHVRLPYIRHKAKKARSALVFRQGPRKQTQLLMTAMKTPCTQLLEPCLFPKLRHYFADFPYLRYSIDQRLQTLETCCGYEYD